MSKLISSITRTQNIRLMRELPKLVSLAASNNSQEFNKKLSPIEESITAFKNLNLNNLSTTSEIPSLLRLPTLDRNIGKSIHTPLIKPCIEDSSRVNILEKFDPTVLVPIEEPSLQVPRMEAARLVVIRRRKMRRHKLRKLRKKMKFVWLKEIQKKEYKKEKLFQASQMAKIREAHEFDAVAYVADFIAKTREKPPPTTWKGKRLPKDVIRILIENDGKYIPK